MFFNEMYRNKKKSHRAVSQIIGSLFMLAVVAAVGSVIFLQGLEGITDFTTFLAVFDQEGITQTTHESMVIEHVRFYANSNNKAVSVWVRNTGDNEIGLDRLYIVRIDTQELVVDKTDETKTVFGKELQVINATGNDVIMPGACTEWTCSDDGSGKSLHNSKYQVSVTTSRGNSFETIVEPFNN